MKTKKLPVEYINKKRPYILFSNDFNISGMLRNGDPFEPHVLTPIEKNHIKIENTVVVDVGANLGCYTLEFAEMVGDGGKVFAFEPQRLVYYQLCGNVILNGYDNVYCYNIGLGDKEGTAELENPDYYFGKLLNLGNIHTNKFLETANESITIKTLDSYKLSNVSIIKLDVQGYENYVLDGMTNTLKENKPYIFIEIEEEHLAHYGLKSDDIISKLDSLGYTVEHIHKYDYIATPKL